MGLPDNDYQILKLSNKFYERYPDPPYTEILKKNSRAYTCLLFQTHYDYFICIPYRSEIIHNYAYHFRNSKRSVKHKSGLDYTKMIIIKDLSLVDNKDAMIDKDEFKETVKNLEIIKRESLTFLEEYIRHCTGEKLLSKEEYRRRYRFSSLKYFHKELEIE